ncbi:MAG: HNH endonuclease family protein, partial [Imperialibacter sp.]
KAFLFDRFLSNQPLDYHEITFQNNGMPQRNEEDANWNLLHRGTQVENYIFNYLDFELWRKEYSGFDKFHFAFRSSIEHYYPQNPVENTPKLDKQACDNFGNLCLLSSSKNSKLNNHTPEAKKDYYRNADVDSLKQRVMMDHLGEWNAEAIEKHAEEMIKILKGSF